MTVVEWIMRQDVTAKRCSLGVPQCRVARTRAPLLLGAWGVFLMGVAVWRQAALSGSSSYLPLLLAIVGAASLTLALRMQSSSERTKFESGGELSGAQSAGPNSSEPSLAALLDALQEGVLLLGPDLRVSSGNTRAAELFGVEPLIGKTMLELTLSSDVAAALAQSVKEGEIRKVPLAIAHPTERLLAVTIVPTRLESCPVIVLAEDQTELNHLRTIRTDFVANVSHELRTPMATVRSMAETILDDRDLSEEDETRFLRRILAEIDRLTAISEDLLTLSASESKPLVKSPVDLSQLVEAACHGMEVQARERNLQLHTDVLPGVVVEADASQLTQVLVNLIGNSVRFTESGSVSVTLERDGAEAVLRVSDTGVGISAEHLPRVFERFFRVDPARSRATGGTGLGLSIVKHIVVSHGGAVEIESEPGRGTTVTVRLPLAA